MDNAAIMLAGAITVIGIVYYVAIKLKSRTPFLKMQDRNTVVKVPLIARENLSHDTVRFSFGLPTPDTVLGLPVGACVKFYCPNVTGEVAGQWNGREDSEKDESAIERKYTPCSSDRQKGSFDMVIKVYAGGALPQFADGGKMSQHMGRLSVGDSIEMSGPWGQIEYTNPGEFTYMKKVLKKNKIGLLAGGTGITPMLQIITAAFENPADTDTTLSLIYANKTEDDILVRDMLEALKAKFPDRFTLHFTLDSPPEKNWPGSKGFITPDMIQTYLPAPGPDTVVLMCGPPPMVQYACKANLDKLGYSKADQLAF